VVDTGTEEADVNQHDPMVAGRIGEHVADGADESRIHVGDLIQSSRHTLDTPIERALETARYSSSPNGLYDESRSLLSV
jgi:hypothetical protein